MAFWFCASGKAIVFVLVREVQDLVSSLGPLMVKKVQPFYGWALNGTGIPSIAILHGFCFFFVMWFFLRKGDGSP